jgi:cell division septum initiation protein DivIVA
MSKPADIAVPMPEFLLLLHDEMQRLASEIHALQEGLSTSLNHAAADPEMMVQAQGLDHLAQHAAGLSEVVARLAAQSPSDWKISQDAVIGVTNLGGLAARLAGTATAAADRGELELL